MINIIKNNLKPGKLFKNPGKGTSEIVSMTDIGIYYKRGNSKMLLKYEYIEEAYEKFKGTTIATTDLKQFKPNVFDTKKKGHDCHCTMLFLLLEEFGMLKDGIQGKGVAGSPFYVTIK